MRFYQLSGAALTAATVVLGKEMPKDQAKAEALYDNGKMHSESMQRKMDTWIGEAEAGLLDSTRWPRLNATKCINGYVDAIPGDPLHKFRCKNVDLYDFINHASQGAPNGWDDGNPDGHLLTGSSSWGWTDEESGREFVANGLFDGTAFLEILPEGKLHQVGFLPVPAPLTYNAFWKEIRHYKHYMLIGSEMPNHGIQIFDMKKLLDIDASEGYTTFDPHADVTGWFTDLPLGRSHNVVVFEEKNLALAVGAQPRTDVCAGGPIFFDLTDPSNPERLSCNPDDGYVHDAQCMTYKGPDERYVGRDLCYGYNEDSLTIYDVTDPRDTSIISITSYQGATYTHQGWILDPEWQQYLVMDDELDELNGNGLAADGFPVTYIWDISDLEKPKQTGHYKGTVRAVDHNQYIKDGLVYQSNYMAGLRIYDISSIPEDPTGDGVCEIAYIDIHPEEDGEPGGGIADYSYGSWSSYAMFKSGFIFINTIERGAFLVKMSRRQSCPKTHPCNADNCLRAMRANSVVGRLEESQEFCAGFLGTPTADVDVVPDYAEKACGFNVISRVSSACSCIPTPTAPATTSSAAEPTPTDDDTCEEED